MRAQIGFLFGFCVNWSGVNRVERSGALHLPCMIVSRVNDLVSKKASKHFLSFASKHGTKATYDVVVTLVRACNNDVKMENSQQITSRETLVLYQESSRQRM